MPRELSLNCFCSAAAPSWSPLISTRASRCGRRHWASIEIENRDRIKRVAIAAHDKLIVHAHCLAAMVELTKAAVLDRVAKEKVGFGADEVFPP